MLPASCAVPMLALQLRPSVGEKFHMQQLPLGMRLMDRAVWANFLPGDNQLALSEVRALAQLHSGASLYLHGAVGSGKSHLLQACCAQLLQAAYLPLAQLLALGPEVLVGHASAALVAIDDLEMAVGQSAWEQALFRLHNECQEQQTPLLVAARQPVVALAVQLPDLRSRLAAMPQFKLHVLNEMQVGEALRLRAQQRGLELPEETLQYLKRRFPRDISGLYQVLDQLDMASLREQRRLTVPFIRQVLGAPP
jgi:DnaA-homolog protein